MNQIASTSHFIKKITNLLNVMAFKLNKKKYWLFAYGFHDKFDYEVNVTNT